MSRITPYEALNSGIEELRPVLEPHGFKYVAGARGRSSGGAFATGAFVAGDRKLEFSYRHGLGLVTYTWGSDSIGHEDFLRFSGAWGRHQFPDFGSSHAESFRALAYDLRTFFADFLCGQGTEFRRIVAERAANPSKFKGFAALDANDA